MQITINTDINAPGCEIVSEDGQSILVQTDWDYPGFASAFGWSVSDVQSPCECENCGECGECEVCDNGNKFCSHDNTDGTVDCKQCGLKAGDFISAAYDFLVDNDGLTVDDPGYFE